MLPQRATNILTAMYMYGSKSVFNSRGAGNYSHETIIMIICKTIKINKIAGSNKGFTLYDVLVCNNMD